MTETAAKKLGRTLQAHGFKDVRVYAESDHTSPHAREQWVVRYSGGHAYLPPNLQHQVVRKAAEFIALKKKARISSVSSGLVVFMPAFKRRP